MAATLAITETRLASAAELDLRKTFECGQCFRWNAEADDSYTGVAGGYAARLWERDGGVFIRASGGSFEFWRDYFDLDCDYSEITFGSGGGEFFESCREFGRGIRILRQEPWEALCSFVISQNNNIKRIKRVVETLCKEFGGALEFEGGVLYTFPEPERIAELDERGLDVLRCGYRAPYLIGVAQAVCGGDLDLYSLSELGYDAAFAALTKQRGIGAKVANCVILFGLHIMTGFPIDVWMRRAIQLHLPKDFDPAKLGPYAGLAQQYIFYYTRENC